MPSYTLAAVAGVAAASLGLAQMGQHDSVSFNQQGKSRKFMAWAAKYNKNYKNSVNMLEHFEAWQETDDFIANFSDSNVRVAHNYISDFTAAQKDELVGLYDERISAEFQVRGKDKEQSVGARGGKNGGDEGSTKCNPRKQVCTCPDGQYLNSRGSCAACAPGCNTCTSATQCTACSAAFTLSGGLCVCGAGQVPSADGSSCVNCGADQYVNGQQCADCGANCTSCGDAANTCDACDATFVVSGGRCVCPADSVIINGSCQSCPAGTYFNNGSCSQCDAKCNTCSDANTCDSCGQNYISTPVNGQCTCPPGTGDNGTGCSACESNQFIDTNGLCTNCGSGCAECSSSTMCDVCQDASMVKNGGICECPSGFAFNGTTCVEQSNCGAGQYLSGTQCMSCSAGCTACVDGTGACTNCEAPFAPVADGTCACPAGTVPFGPAGNPTSCKVPEAANRVVAAYSSTASTVDWVSKGVVRPVQNQGGCGSCWTFSAAQTAETAHAIKTGTLFNSSEQQLLDCELNSFDCQGGYQSYALRHLYDNGANTEADYPYQAYQYSCREANYPKAYQLSEAYGYSRLSNSVSAMKTALRSQTVSIAAYSSDAIWSQYNGGVVHRGITCRSDTINHAMQAVGFGTQDGYEYVTIRNSWGATWGDRGYIKIELTDDVPGGVCGTLLQNYVARHNI